MYTEVVIGFEETLVTTPEGSGVVELCAVIREGSLERSVDVTFSTEPGTAEGGDYIYVHVHAKQGKANGSTQGRQLIS